MLSFIIREGGLVFKTNEETKTASVIGCNIYSSQIIIPRSIKSYPNECTVTTISKDAFKLLNKIKSIEISSDSELQTIEEDAFHGSTIESLSIPSSLIELKDGWCSFTSNFIDIKISHENPYFKMYEDKYLLKKSSLENENFDVLLFCCRNVQCATIPNFVEVIGSNAFEELKQIEISNDSKIRMICDSAFSFTSIENIKLPCHITSIGDHAFYCCYNLKRIEIPENSNLQIIGREAFYKTAIKTFSISHHITKICEGAFFGCQKLKTVTISSDSNLQSIGNNAFSKTAIDSFTFPHHLICIGKRAFAECRNLKYIVIPSNSQLKEISDYAFSKSKISSLSIPSKFIIYGRSIFNDCFIQIIEIYQYHDVNDFNLSIFLRMKNAIFMIPSSLREHFNL